MGYQETYNYIARAKDKEIILKLMQRYGMYTKEDMFASLYGLATIEHKTRINHKTYNAGSQFFLLTGDRGHTGLKNILLSSEYELTKEEKQAVSRTIAIPAEDMDKFYGIKNLKEERIEIPANSYSNLLPPEYISKGNTTQNSEEIENKGNELKINFEHLLTAHEHQLKSQKREDGFRPSLVVNAFAGPGAGKTTCCLEIAEKLKKQGYVVEYVQEYAKELVWEKNFSLLDGTQKNQLLLLDEQMKRVDRLYGRVDFIITDSPLLLNGIYNKELTEDYSKMLSDLTNQYDNFSFFVKRDLNHYEEEGRLQSLDEAIEKDNEVEEMLNQNHIYYGTYTHQTVDKIIKNLQTSLERIRTRKDNARILKHQEVKREVDTIYHDFIDELHSSDISTKDKEFLINKYQWVKRYVQIALENGGDEKQIESLLSLCSSDTSSSGEKMKSFLQKQNLLPDTRTKIYTEAEQQAMSDELKQMIPIIDVASHMGYTVTRKSSSGRYYSLAEHDSVIFDMQLGKNCFYRNSTIVHSAGSGVTNGATGSIIDFVMYFGNKTIDEAYRYLYDMVGGQEVVYNRINGITNSPSAYTSKREFSKPAPKPTKVELPVKGNSRKNVYAYLQKTRGISETVINEWFDKDMLYQDDHNNCVFVSRNEEKEPVFACVRGTSTYKRFVMDCRGNQYDKGFYIDNQATELIVTESVIDAMSLMTIAEKKGLDYHKYNYLILASATKQEPLLNVLEANPDINLVSLSLDNDPAGRKAISAMQNALENKGIQTKISIPSLDGYDWNKYLTDVVLQNNKTPKPSSAEVNPDSKQVRLYRSLLSNARAYQYWLEEQSNNDEKGEKYLQEAKKIDELFSNIPSSYLVSEDVYNELKGYANSYRILQEKERPKQAPQTTSGVKKYRLSKDKITYAEKLIDILSEKLDDRAKEYIQTIKEDLASISPEGKVSGEVFGRFKDYEEQGKKAEKSQNPESQNGFEEVTGETPFTEQPYLVEIFLSDKKSTLSFTTLKEALEMCLDYEQKGASSLKLIANNSPVEVGTYEYDEYFSLAAEMYLLDEKAIDGSLKYIQAIADERHLTPDFLHRASCNYQEKNNPAKYGHFCEKINARISPERENNQHISSSLQPQKNPIQSLLSQKKNQPSVVNKVLEIS